MTQIDHARTHNLASARRARRAAPQTSRRSNSRLVSEAVVASYLHDISQRHRDDAHASESRRSEWGAGSRSEVDFPGPGLPPAPLAA